MTTDDPCEAADTHAHHVYLRMDVQAVLSAAKWRSRPASTVMGKHDLRSLALSCRARIVLLCFNGWRMASSPSASLMIAAPTDQK